MKDVVSLNFNFWLHLCVPEPTFVIFIFSQLSCFYFKDKQRWYIFRINIFLKNVYAYLYSLHDYKFDLYGFHALDLGWKQVIVPDT